MAQFEWYDYLTFGGMLLVSTAIGVYHAVRASMNKKSSNTEFLLAGRSMSALPVALSVLASFFSASTLLGTPAEIYMYGLEYWMSVFGAVCAPITGAFLFGPLFFRLKLLSVFQYLEMRFGSKLVRFFGVGIFILRTTVGMGIVLFGPAVALQAVTDLPVEISIPVIGIVCTFYSTIGGMRAVIWADVFQTVVMLVGMLTVIIKGTIDAGGIERVWNAADNWSRLNLFNWNPDPFMRQNFWAIVIGSYFAWLPPYAVDQQMVQRFSSASSLRTAKRALLFNVPGMFVIITLCTFLGVIIFAYFSDCDPMATGKVKDPNQLVPYFVTLISVSLPGLSGLFMSSLFSGALSSISSMINSLAAVAWEDILKPRFTQPVPEVKATRITKLLVLFFGLVGVGSGFAASNMGGTMLQASITFNGSAGAPLVGIFILGTLFSFTNWLGALAGGLLGFLLPLWLSIGAYVTKPYANVKLPTDTSCSNSTDALFTTLSTSTSIVTSVAPASDSPLDEMYKISFWWFSFLGIATVIVVGVIVSCVTNVCIEKKEIDDELLLRSACSERKRRVYHVTEPAGAERAAGSEERVKQTTI